MPSPRFDMHLHSRSGRGELAPRDLVALAADRGLSGIALTDVNTIAGLSEATAAAALLGIELIAGVELTCTATDGEHIHILGYLFDPQHDAITSLLNEVQSHEGIPAAPHAMHALHQSGGVAVLARPAMRHGGIDEAAIRELATSGLDGIEVDHPGQAEEDIRRLASLASELGLIEVAGSDDNSASDSRLGCRTSSERVLLELRARIR